MNSQEVVDYVNQRICKTPEDKLATICEELFDHCLAPDTMGDGTGCDNMTAVIVKFKDDFKHVKDQTEAAAAVNGGDNCDEEDQQPAAKKIRLDTSSVESSSQ